MHARTLGWIVSLVLVMVLLFAGCAQPAAPSPTAVPAKAPAAPTVAAPTSAPAPTAVPAAPTKAPAAAPTNAAAAAPVAAPAPSVFKIGALFPMTGAGAFYGKVMSQGARMAVDEINAAGGLDGTKFELVIEDNLSGQAKAAAAGMQKLVEIDKVVGVMTSYSAVTLAAQPMAAEKKVLMMNGGGFGTDLIGKPFLYNTKVMGSLLAQAVSDYAFKEWRVRNMGIIFVGDASGFGTRDYLRPLWEKWGGKVVAMETHQVTDRDYTTQLSKIKQAQPDILGDFSLGGHVGPIVKQARELGMNIPVVAIEVSPDDIKVAGQAIDGMHYAVDGLDADSKDPATQNFVKAYKAKYNEVPEMYAANYYDAVKHYYELLKGAKAKGGDWFGGEALNKELLARKSFPSVYGGQLTFMSDGTSSKPVTLFKIEGGKAIQVKTVSLQ